MTEISVIRNVYLEHHGLRFEARPHTVGIDPDDLARLVDMPRTAARESLIACLQENARLACELLLTAETAGRA